VFDFDDTLIQSRDDRAVVLLQALASFGVEADTDALPLYWGQPFEELVTRIAPSVAASYPEFLHHYSEVLQARPPTPCAGVLEAMPRLARVAELFVHSASHSLLVRTDLDSLGLLKFFSFVCGSDWQSTPKPHPGSFAVLARLLETQRRSFRDTWYVGDSLSDVDIAERANLRFVGVTFRTPAAAFYGRGVDSSRLIDSMTELATIVSATSPLQGRGGL
jgi:phosphoglycolate phosphatase-like HAD superfamily hydrolase